MNPLGWQLDDEMQHQIFGAINRKLYMINAKTSAGLEKSLHNTIERKLYLRIYWKIDWNSIQEVKNL